MNYLSSTKEHPLLTDIITLLARVLIGISMIFLHGLPKLEKLMAGGEIKFYSFLGLGGENTLILATLLEMIGGFLIIIGLFTRGASFILLLLMAIAVFGVHSADPFSVREASLLYFTVFLLIFALGPKKYSVDNMISKRRESKW